MDMNNNLQTLCGDCLEILPTLPESSVQCCVTSPPYYGLRDYGTASWEGGDPSCDHSCGGQVHDNKAPGAIQTGVRPGCDSSTCRKCGAKRVDAQIGLEQTPDEYVAKLVQVFREVRRVLREDGTCWVNLGDSYAGSWGNYGGQNRGQGSQRQITNGSKATQKAYEGLESWRPPTTNPPGLKPKDLIGIPWRVAFALQADGWWLRQDIIWHKPNPMPESVTDRCTKSHEYIFLLSKGPRYYFDAEAIKEAAATLPQPRKRPNGLSAEDGKKNGLYRPNCGVSETRNRRSVWTVATQPFSGAHFATFPPDLIKPCILAGCPSKVCAVCGRPWERVVERNDRGYDGSKYGERAVTATGGAISGGTAKSTLGSSNGKLTGETRTIGTRPTCSCNGATQPGTVLDPFGGSGTTGMVALELGRRATLIELNPEYAKLIDQRTNVTPGLAFA
jgi:DNA modification methylase